MYLHWKVLYYVPEKERNRGWQVSRQEIPGAAALSQKLHGGDAEQCPWGDLNLPGDSLTNVWHGPSHQGWQRPGSLIVLRARGEE
jgi:hypothetical protein